jgi:hypothetical protein
VFQIALMSSTINELFENEDEDRKRSLREIIVLSFKVSKADQLTEIAIKLLSIPSVPFN